ncbi:MAG: phage tail protein [Chitinophagales bacterium]
MQSASTEIILFAGNFAPRDYQKCLGEQMILNSSLYYELGYTYSKPPVPGSNAKVSQIVPTLNAKSLIDGTFDDYHGSSLTFQICHSGLRDEMYGDVGMIKMYAGKTLPKGWVFCEGQELSIASYPDLFAAIGTKYGGDGTTNFVLPKLNSTSLSDLKTPKFAIATTTMGDDDDREGMYGLITLFGGDTCPLLTGYFVKDKNSQ